MISDRRHEIGMFHSWISSALPLLADAELAEMMKSGKQAKAETRDRHELNLFSMRLPKKFVKILETSSIFHSVRVVTTFRTFLETCDDAWICGISRMYDVGSWRISLCSQFLKTSTITWFWKGDDKEMKNPRKIKEKSARLGRWKIEALMRSNNEIEWIGGEYLLNESACRPQTNCPAASDTINVKCESNQVSSVGGSQSAA